jgi:putative ABC transport system ATP-binding protein
MSIFFKDEPVQLSEMPVATLQLRQVQKRYVKGREQIEVLRGLDLVAYQGEMVSIMGPSGAGKSTLLDVLAGVVPCDSGEVNVAGHPFHGAPEARRTQLRARHIGFVFQFYCLIPVLSAEENVSLPLHLWKLSRSERAARTQAALNIVGMQHRSRHLPGELSGGEQQRIAIARAIAGNPDILLCDEPTGDLSRDVGAEIMSVMRELCSVHGKTIVVVTHDPDVAAVADQCLKLENGILVPAGKRR